MEKELFFLTDPSNKKGEDEGINMLENNFDDYYHDDNQKNIVIKSRETNLDEEYNVRLDTKKDNFTSNV